MGAVSLICRASGTEWGSEPCPVQKARQTDTSGEQTPEQTQDASTVVFSLRWGCIFKASLPSGFTFCALVSEQCQCTQDPTEMTQNWEMWFCQQATQSRDFCGPSSKGTAVGCGGYLPSFHSRGLLLLLCLTWYSRLSLSSSSRGVATSWAQPWFTHLW